MEGGNLWVGWRKNSSFRYLDNVDEEEELKMVSNMPSIPQTPKEPMEFLSRSWSLSASEITRALAFKQRPILVDKNPNATIPKKVASPVRSGKITGSFSSRRTRSISRWFQNKEFKNGAPKKKDKARAENARMHAALSVAGLAAALAAVTAAENSKDSGSKLGAAMASATELLASHCIEKAESAGADHDRVAAVVRSAVDIRSPSEIVTFTAAAATALRGEAALKARFSREGKKNASSISPCDKGATTEAQRAASFNGEMEVQDPHPPCSGDLLHHTRKGILRWKNVSVYINKKSEVIIKMKSKHIGGALTKKNKGVVYGVCDDVSAWTSRKEFELENVEMYFGVKTAQGVVEFKCKNKIHKQEWVEALQHLLRQTTSNVEEEAERERERSFKHLDLDVQKAI